MLTTIRSTGVTRTAPLEARLQSFAPLKPLDLELLRTCCEDLKGAPAGTEILAPGAGREHPRLVVSGWAAAARALPDGRRQILQIFLPGDVLGVTSVTKAGAVALSNVTTTDARPLTAAFAAQDPAHAGLRLAWERAVSERELQLLDQIVRLGRLSAYERTAHLLMELMTRHRQAGLSDGRRMPWPLTQETLADVLGLSVVHVNRILQQLRRESMIQLRSGQMVVPDLQRLAAVAVWDA
ncbi:MAG: Crp/Fnr family transcriptional regulator [Phenylobacterium sp.]